jgi:hypothetical protein
VSHRKVPKFALARGLWLGEISDELQQLSFAEKLLIGKVRHNRCVVHVAKGMHKMVANAVTFEHPMQKIYNILPPPIEEMDEVLAFIFTGPSRWECHYIKTLYMEIYMRSIYNIYNLTYKYYL